MRQREQRIRQPVEIGQQPFQHQRIDIRPRVADCRQYGVGVEAAGGEEGRIGGGKIAVGVAAAHEAGDAERARS